MTAAIQQTTPQPLAGLDAETMTALMAGGDTSKLNHAQKNAYYLARCEAAGLDPRAEPFGFMRLNGKEQLYAKKAAGEQLAAKHGVKMTIQDQRTENDIRIVTVRAEARDGRVTEEIGALPVKGLTGEALSNALMKAVTKAKRRAILSLCGLGALDETEVESIPGAHVEAPRSAPVAVVVDPLPAATGPAPKTTGDKPALPATGDALWTEWTLHCRSAGISPAEGLTTWKEKVALVLGDRAPSPGKWNEEQIRLVAVALMPSYSEDIPF